MQIIWWWYWSLWWDFRHDLSVALDKVLHNFLLYKLKQNVISRKLLDIFTDFLDEFIYLNNSLHGTELKHKFLKDWYISHYHFYFIMMIFLMIYYRILNCYPIILPFFSAVTKMSTFANTLDKDLSKNSDCSIQQKKMFDPDSRKEAQKFIFFRKHYNSNYESICKSILMI